MTWRRKEVRWLFKSITLISSSLLGNYRFSHHRPSCENRPLSLKSRLTSSIKEDWYTLVTPCAHSFVPWRKNIAAIFVVNVHVSKTEDIKDKLQMEITLKWRISMIVQQWITIHGFSHVSAFINKETKDCSHVKRAQVNFEEQQVSDWPVHVSSQGRWDGGHRKRTWL